MFQKHSHNVHLKVKIWTKSGKKEASLKHDIFRFPGDKEEERVYDASGGRECTMNNEQG